MTNNYQLKPPIVSAVRLSWATWEELVELVGDIYINEATPGMLTSLYHQDMDEDGPYIKVMLVDAEYGEQWAYHGDWIVKHGDGSVEVLIDTAFREKWMAVCP